MIHFFFEFSPGGGVPTWICIQLPIRLCSLFARWVHGNQSYKGEQKESINKKTHTNTQKKRERREVTLGKPTIA
jgi:hypothetical protein